MTQGELYFCEHPHRMEFFTSLSNILNLKELPTKMGGFVLEEMAV